MKSVSAKKALVVDDDSLGCILLKSHLQKLSIEAQTANSSSEALGIIENNPDIEFVFVDYHLPDMSGDKLIQHISGINPKMKCAIVSGNNVSDCKELDGDFDIKRFITKPVTENKLKVVLATFL